MVKSMITTTLTESKCQNCELFHQFHSFFSWIWFVVAGIQCSLSSSLISQVGGSGDVAFLVNEFGVLWVCNFRFKIAKGVIISASDSKELA